MNKNFSTYVTGSVVLNDDSYMQECKLISFDDYVPVQRKGHPRHAKVRQFDWMISSILSESARGISSHACSKSSAIAAGVVFFVTGLCFVFIGA